MTVISEIDEYGINTNIKVRYLTDRIYVSQHCSLSAVSLQSFCSLSLVYLQSVCSLSAVDNCVLLNSMVFSFLKTYTGTILVAVNPYHQLNIYEQVRFNIMEQHKCLYPCIDAFTL